MLCVNWVSEGTFHDQEWVSESTSAMQEEEVLAMGFALRNLRSVRGTMEHAVVFSANAVKSNIGKRRNKHRNIPRSCGHGDCGSDLLALWRFAHATNVHVDNGGCGFVQNTK